MCSLIMLVKALPFMNIQSHTNVFFLFAVATRCLANVISMHFLRLCSSDKTVSETTDFIVSAMQSPKYCFIIIVLWCCSLRIMSLLICQQSCLHFTVAMQPFFPLL
jgi:hypothetical protein